MHFCDLYVHVTKYLVAAVACVRGLVFVFPELASPDGTYKVRSPSLWLVFGVGFRVLVGFDDGVCGLSSGPFFLCVVVAVPELVGKTAPKAPNMVQK